MIFYPILINFQAYEILSKEESRRDYDRFGHQSGNSGQSGGDGGHGGHQHHHKHRNSNFDFHDFFKDFDSFFKKDKTGHKKKTSFNFDDIFGDGSDFDDDEADFFGGFDFVKKHFKNFGFGKIPGFDDMDLSRQELFIDMQNQNLIVLSESFGVSTKCKN